jgi:hypothetical protein
MGVLADDRRPSFEGWLDRKLDGLAGGIGREAGAWLRTMRDGGPRSRARSIETVWRHMNNVRPALLDWSQRYDRLREVTRDDIQAILGGLHGTRRSRFLVSLRSLFAFCKTKGMVFGNPASGIKVGQHPYGIAQPLGQADAGHAAGAAATPSARLVLVPAAVHAARTGAIRAARLDDVDLGNRRLIIAGRVRPIDEFTRQILPDWPGYRRTRRPDTANPHLLINQQPAMGTGPVSTIYHAKTKLRGRAATLERLRVDRQLEEARAHGPGPLHLAAVPGLDPRPPSATPRTPGCSWRPQLSSKPPGFRRQETARPAARTPHSLAGMDTSSGEDLVRAGYDALSHRYRGDDDSAEEYRPWLADLQTHLPDRRGRPRYRLRPSGCPVPGSRRSPGNRRGHQRHSNRASPQARPGRHLHPGRCRPAALLTRFLRRHHLPLRPHPHAARPATPPAAQHRRAASPRRMAARHHRAGRPDRHSRQLAWRPRHDVVEPRRSGHLPVMAPAGRLGGHHPAIRSRGRQRPRSLPGPAATPPNLQIH